MVFNWIGRRVAAPITNRIEEISIDVDDRFNSQQRSNLLGPDYKKIYWSQAWPNVLSSLWHRFMITFMIMILARSGPIKASSYSVVSPIITIITALAHWIGSGVNNNMSYFIGESHTNMAEVTLANGVYMSLGLGAIETCIFCGLAKFIAPGLGGHGPEQEGAVKLLYTIGAFPIFYNLSHVGSGIFRSQGLVLWDMTCTMLSSFLALIVSIFSVRRKHGGTVAFAIGLGLDPLLCSMFNFLIIKFNKKVTIKFSFRRFSTIMFRIASKGASGALNQLGNMIMLIILDEGIVRVVGGTDAPIFLAARGTTFSLLAIVEHLGVALTISSTLPMASMARGSSMYLRFQQINSYAIKVAFIVIFTISVLFLFSSWFLPAAYFSEPVYQYVMKQFMMIVFCGSAIISPTMSLTELLQANGLSLWASLSALLRSLFINSPILLITMFSTQNVWTLVSCLFIGDFAASAIATLIIYFERNNLLLTKRSADVFMRIQGESHVRL